MGDARLVITIDGKDYYAIDFFEKPIILTKNSGIYSVRIENKKYLVKNELKGKKIGYIYHIDKGLDGNWWITFKDKNKFYHIPLKNAINSDYIRQYQIKTIQGQKKDLEQKIKQAEKKGAGSFFDSLTNKILVGALIFSLLKK